MIRLVHFADLHIGTETYGRMDPVTGVSSRLSDFLRSLDELVDYVLGHDVALVLFAGDAYKSREPNPTHQREFAQRVLRLARAGVDVVLLAGNHDVPPVPMRASSVDIFATLEVEHVHVMRGIACKRVETRQGPVQVVALPWVSRSTLLTHDEHRGKSIEKVDATLVARVEEILHSLIDGLDGVTPAVLVAHGSVSEAAFGSERSVMLGNDLILPQGLLADAAFDYVALGHIHKHQVLRKDPPVIYSGSLERIDFGEEAEDKGFIVAEVEHKGPPRFDFVKVSARRFVTVDVRPRGDDPTQEVLDAVARRPIADAVVRVVVRVDEEAAPRVDMAAVRRALDGAFHVASVTLDVARASRVRLGAGPIEELTPEQMLARYLESRGISGERSERLVARAKKLMQEPEA